VTTRDYHFADLVAGELRLLGVLPLNATNAFHVVWYVFATRPRTVHELARTLNVHRCTVSRAVTAAGLPPLTRWIQLARALWACRWMAVTGEPVTRTAVEAGYSDPFAFSRQLHRISGIRPSEIRDSRDWRVVLPAFIKHHAKAGAR